MLTGEWVEQTERYKDAQAVRLAVFVDEQRIPREEEFDAMDERASHIVIYDGERPCATGRVYMLDEKSAILGRICVLKECRGQHLGDLVMRMLIQKAVSMGAQSLELSAQEYAVPFYEKFGFRSEGEGYMEVDIPHRRMRAMADELVLQTCCK